MDLYDLYMVPTLFPWVIIIFQGVQTKFHFLTKFSHLEEFVDYMKNLKHEHQSTNMNTKFWGGGGGVGHGRVGVGGGVGYYNFPRSTNKIKSFDEILTSENIFLHFSVVGEGQTLF